MSRSIEQGKNWDEEDKNKNPAHGLPKMEGLLQARKLLVLGSCVRALPLSKAQQKYCTFDAWPFLLLLGNWAVSQVTLWPTLFRTCI